jgi:hypothetical protein
VVFCRKKLTTTRWVPLLPGSKPTTRLSSPLRHSYQMRLGSSPPAGMTPISS